MNNNRKNGLIITGILAFTLGLVYYNSREGEPKKELTNTNNQTDKYWLADAELESEQEKITLLSILKNTSKDSITLILRDYLLHTENESVPYEKTINIISQKYNLPSRKVASIVFSYKYEMLTNDNITDDFSKNSQSSNTGGDSESNAF